MPTIKIPKDVYTITVQNLTRHPLIISVPYGGHVFRNFSIEKNSSIQVDRDLFLMGRGVLQALRKEGKIWYEDHVQVPCDEQELGCDGSGGTGMGPQGSTGAIGATGAQGATGFGGSGGTGSGSQGVTGLQGVTGPNGGPQGVTGMQGFQGATGHGSIWFNGSGSPTGVGSNGDYYLDDNNGNVYTETGGSWILTGNIKGPVGDTGPIGPAGPGGMTGMQGSTGPLGPIGAQGITGPQGIQGPTGILGNTGLVTQGTTGVLGATGLQGIQGATGLGGGSNIVYGIINRYQADPTIGAEVWVTSSSMLYLDLSWSRLGTTLTITMNAHGHAVGDFVIVRNANVDYIATAITSVTPNTFDIIVNNTGAFSGSNARYSLGFNFAHNPGLTGGDLQSPSNGEVQLLSMKVRTGQRAGTTYTLTVPASVTNGAGQNTSLGDVYIPSFSVRSDADTLSAIAGTIAVNQGSGYSAFTFGNLGSGTLSRFILLQF